MLKYKKIQSSSYKTLSQCLSSLSSFPLWISSDTTVTNGTTETAILDLVMAAVQAIVNEIGLNPIVGTQVTMVAMRLLSQAPGCSVPNQLSWKQSDAPVFYSPDACTFTCPLSVVLRINFKTFNLNALS